MNRIQQAIHEIDPDYVITDAQRDEIASADDPSATAAQLAAQVENLRQEIAAGLGVAIEHVTSGDALSIATLNRAVTRHVGNDPQHQSGRLDRARVLRIGQQSVEGLTAIYREVLSREPDAEGLAYWRGVYDDGMPLSEVIRHIENSPEAKSMK